MHRFGFTHLQLRVGFLVSVALVAPMTLQAAVDGVCCHDRRSNEEDRCRNGQLQLFCFTVALVPALVTQWGRSLESSS